MPEFAYTARKSAGGIERGKIDGNSQTEASTALRARGLIVLSLKEGRAGRGLNFAIRRKKVPFKEKIIFTRQLAVMIRAGLSIIKALAALQRQTENAYFKEVIESMIKQIEGGKTLSKTMIQYPKVFPEVYTAVVRAGEETGQLADVLLNLADQQEKEADLISKVTSAMIYPAIIFLALIGVGFLVVFFVLPNLQTIFADSGQKLPLLTRLLMGFSYFARKYFLLMAGMGVGLFFLLRYWISRDSGRSVFDKLKITLPIFGNLTKKVYMARFARTMAMLIKASLPILDSIRIIRKTINNVHYNGAFTRIEKAVESGKSLSGAINKEKLFPAMVAQLANLGEESGTLDSVLLEVATFYDKEVDTISRNLSTLLEPLMLIIMGIGVGFVVAAVLGPIYGLVQNFSG